MMWHMAVAGKLISIDRMVLAAMTVEPKAYMATPGSQVKFLVIQKMNFAFQLFGIN